jgi:hypothetical protein
MMENDEYMDEDEIVNWDQLELTLQNRSPEVIKILREFIYHLRPELEILKHFILTDRYQEAEELSHSLRGTSFTFGLDGLAYVLLEVETCAHEKQFLRKHLIINQFIPTFKDSIRIIQDELAI